VLLNSSQSSQVEGIKVAPSALVVNHLLFADDSLLFFKGSNESVMAVSNLLESYCKTFGKN
jgi:hypothetical protein